MRSGLRTRKGVQGSLRPPLGRAVFSLHGKACLNGHEYLKRQLAQEGIPYEALDNGLLSCTDPQRAQQICDELSPEKIEAVLGKWLGRLPHPFSQEDQEADYRYDISILQCEFSLTQVFDVS